jgi:glycosyltransferase involved in cell wall biosynthesis
MIWLGSVFEEARMLSSPAISPAANRWQSGLLGSLVKSGCRVRTLGHRPERAWPRGQLHILPTEETPALPGTMRIAQRCVGYWNLPKLRERDLAVRYGRAFRRLIREQGRPDVVFSYNVYSCNAAVAREASRIGVPWVPVIADAPGDGASAIRLARHLKMAAGAVFLSWGLFNEAGAVRKLHLDGGVSDLRFHPEDPPSYLPSGRPMVFYSGSVVMEFGLATLIEAFSQIPDSEVRLVICGKGSPSAVLEAARRDPRIALMGCVEEQRLVQLAREASIMVNPRPNLRDHENNFPSKVLEYLSFGKPVVSTWTPGLHPEYRALLAVVAEQRATALVRTIKETLAWSREMRTKHAERCAHFLQHGRLWDQQAARLTTWLDGDVAQSRSVDSV